MKRNLAPLDRLLRVIIAAALFVIALVIGPGGVAGIVLLVLAAIMVATAAAGSCPLYRLLHIDTRRPQRGPGSASPAPR